MTPERLADWDALCAWLEAQPYNASYAPGSRGAYLLTGPCPARKEVQARDAFGRYAWVANPNLEKEKEIARYCREIVKERRRLQLVYWSSGHGWRLRKDYREKIEAERVRLGEQAGT
jgi:hypothetical protein